MTAPILEVTAAVASTFPSAIALGYAAKAATFRKSRAGMVSEAKALISAEGDNASTAAVAAELVRAYGITAGDVVALALVLDGAKRGRKGGKDASPADAKAWSIVNVARATWSQNVKAIKASAETAEGDETSNVKSDADKARKAITDARRYLSKIADDAERAALRAELVALLAAD